MHIQLIDVEIMNFFFRLKKILGHWNTLVTHGVATVVLRVWVLRDQSQMNEND